MSPAMALKTRPSACSRSLAVTRISFGGSCVNPHQSVKAALPVNKK